MILQQVAKAQKFSHNFHVLNFQITLSFFQTILRTELDKKEAPRKNKTGSFNSLSKYCFSLMLVWFISIKPRI